MMAILRREFGHWRGMSPMRLSARVAPALILLGCLVDSVPARAEGRPKALTFCAEPAAMPRTGKATDDSPRGLDVAVARLVCKKMGRPFAVHWCANPRC